jgi:hypothetical protein
MACRDHLLFGWQRALHTAANCAHSALTQSRHVTLGDYRAFAVSLRDPWDIGKSPRTEDPHVGRPRLETHVVPISEQRHRPRLVDKLRTGAADHRLKLLSRKAPHVARMGYDPLEQKDRRGDHNRDQDLAAWSSQAIRTGTRDRSTPATVVASFCGIGPRQASIRRSPDTRRKTAALRAESTACRRWSHQVY